jgi:hypothetical protein
MEQRMIGWVENGRLVEMFDAFLHNMLIIIIFALILANY